MSKRPVLESVDSSASSGPKESLPVGTRASPLSCSSVTLPAWPLNPPCQSDADLKITPPGSWSPSPADYASILRAAVCRRPGPGLDPEDAAQEAWLVLVACIAAVTPDERNGLNPAWIVVVIRNRLADQARFAARRRCQELNREMANTLVSREEGPAEVFERQEVQERVRAILEAARSRISGPTYRIVVLHWLQGRTFLEIAGILQIPVAQVRDRHRRALPVLRALWMVQQGEGPVRFRIRDHETHPRELELEEVMP